MSTRVRIGGPLVPLMSLFIFIGWNAESAPLVLNTNLAIRRIMNTATADGAQSVRIAKDPRDGKLYYLKLNGDIYQVTVQPGDGASTSEKIYSAADHGIGEGAQGLAFGPTGAIYIVGNTTTNNGDNALARIIVGAPNSTGGRDWALVAQSQPYPRSKTAYDHGFSGIIVSPDGSELYVSSGSRTDHGEVQSAGGVFPDAREVPLTANIFRLPTHAANLILYTNGFASDPPRQYTGGLQPGRPARAFYPLAFGFRNCFDLAFAPNGDLFGTENGPDRDMPDELNWIRNAHFGFPWRIGGLDNPQQFPDYDPSQDRLLDPRYSAVSGGLYHNDPAFPPPPSPFQFSSAEPVINIGPDADSFRDPADGQVKDASDLGLTLSTFTPHRSPRGLVFDQRGNMAPPFYHHSFVLGGTKGDPNGASVAGPFKDASEDMLDLELTKLGDTNYQARVTRIVAGFSNPIDAETVGHRIYVLESGGDQNIWEVTFPVHPGNDPPNIAPSPFFPVGDTGWEAGTFFRTAPGRLVVGDSGPNATSPFELELTATSNNPALVPDPNISLWGEGAPRFVSVEPVAGQTGEAVITLTVTDRGPGPPKSSSLSFKLTVVPFNNPPVISSIADQTIERNTSTPALPFMIVDAETAPDQLVLNVYSDYHRLIPPGRIAIAGNGNNRTATLTPERDQVGTAHINIIVTDGGKKTSSASFTLTVQPTPHIKGDFNQDGQADLIFQDDTGFLGAWLMNGAELSSASYLTPANVGKVPFPFPIGVRLPGAEPVSDSSVGDIGFRVVGTGDFNRDDQEDLLFQHSDGRLGIWFMHGTALVSTAWLSPNNPGDKGWRVAATGPMDQDQFREPDLVYQHTDGTLAVWHMAGLGIMRADLLDPSHPGDARWRVVSGGDLNGDGQTDLIFQHTDGTLATWFMNQTKMISAALLDPPHPVDPNWRVVAAGQFARPLTTTLSGAAERPTPVVTNARGAGQLTLIGNQLTLDINYSGLSGPATGAHLHGPATASQAAGIQIDLAPSNGGSFGSSGMLTGPVRLTAEQAKLVRYGLTYVNIHTAAHPNGEIRGQVLSNSALAGSVDLIFQHTDGTLAIWFLDGIELRAAQLLTPPKPGTTWRVVAPK